MQQFTLYNGSDQLEVISDYNLGQHIAKICTNQTEIFLLNTSNDLFTGTITIHSNQQQTIHLTHLRSLIVDCECTTDSLYVVQQNGCVYRKYLIDLQQTTENEWQEIIVPNPKICVHGYRSANDKILIGQINCNKDGILFTSLKRELYACGNFGDVVKSECPVPVECFSGFKIIQISTGEHFVVVLTHKKPHMDNIVDDHNSEGSSSNDSSSVYINAECSQCAPNSMHHLSDGIYKSTTETSIASSASQSDVFDYDNSSIMTIDQTESISTTAISHKDTALNFLLESLSIASEDAGKQTKLLKENVSNLTSMVRESVRTLSRHMSGSSDNDPPDCTNTETISTKQETVEIVEDDKSMTLPITGEFDLTHVDGPDSFCEDLSLDIESVVDVQHECDVEKNITKLCRNGASLLSTNVWCFGSVNKGHLGTGDHIKRTRINSVLGLNGQGVVKISSGKEHSMALTLDGRLFYWGMNDRQQVHQSTEIDNFSAPRKYRSQYNILDITCSDYSSYILTNDFHTVELRSKENHNDNQSKTFVTLKSNESNNTLIQMKIPIFLSSGNIYGQNYIHFGVIEKYFTIEQKCLYDTLTTYLTIVKPFMKKIYLISLPKNHIFDQLCQQYQNILNIIALNVNTMMEYYTGNKTIYSFVNILCIKNATEMIIAYRSFVNSLCDIICIHGFRLINKMLDDDKPLPKNRAKGFGRPILSLSNYIQLINDITLSMHNTDDADAIDADKTIELIEMKQCLDDRKCEWERFISEKDALIESAEKTSKFWDSIGGTDSKNPMIKLQTSDRRLILDSKDITLKLLPSSRFSTHFFILFNDSFCHYANNTIESYNLKTIWLSSIVDNDQRKNVFKVITPEKHFILQATNHENKMKWLDAIERHLKQCLDKINFIKIPQYRNASYTFDEKHLKYPNAKYFGRWYVGQMHGIGHLEFIDGRVYNGQMYQDIVQGFGRMYTPGIGIYEGDFESGKYHGYGVLEIRNHATYEGNFKDGMQHGHGVLRADNFMYIGEFRNDIMHGYGVLDNSDTGEKYLGMFSDNKKNGHGISITMDGNYFEGNFIGDKFCGNGIAVFENGSYYEGDLTFDGPDGKGSLFLPNSIVKNESLEVEYPSIEMTGNVLSGNLSGHWNDVKINHGNISMNQSFPIFPKSLGQQAIDNGQKWKSLFSDWELDVFGVDNHLDYKQYWNKVAIYITNTKRRETLKSEGFSESYCYGTEKLQQNRQQTNKNTIENIEIVSMIKNAGITTTKFTQNNLGHNNNNHLVVHNNNNNNGTILYDNLKNEANLLDIFKLKKDVTNSSAIDNTQSYPTNRTTTTIEKNYEDTNQRQRRKSIIDNLDYVPDFGLTKLDKQNLDLIKDYLTKAFRDPSHPFGVLNSRISFCFYTSYGCWKVKPKSIILPQAMKEWQHISQRIYRIVRKLFPALPIESDYCDGEMISHQSLMYPILLSDGIYSTLFVLYAGKCSQNDELYRQRLMICDKKTDEELALFLKMDNSLLSLIKSVQFDETLCCLKLVKEKNCPREMLNQIEQTFKLLTNVKNNNVLGKFNLLNADNIMPLTIFLILRAGIPHLGAELLLLEDLMGAEFEPIMLGFAGYCFATIKATYQHIISDNFLQD